MISKNNILFCQELINLQLKKVVFWKKLKCFPLDLYIIMYIMISKWSCILHSANLHFSDNLHENVQLLLVTSWNGTTFPLKTITGSHHFWLDKKSSHLYVHVIIYYKFQLQLQKGFWVGLSKVGLIWGGGACVQEPWFHFGLKILYEVNLGHLLWDFRNSILWFIFPPTSVREPIWIKQVLSTAVHTCTI